MMETLDPQAIDPNRVYLPREAARLLGISKTQLMRLHHDHGLRAVCVGTRFKRFYGKTLIEFIESGGAEPGKGPVPGQVRRRPRLRMAGGGGASQ